MPSNLTDIATAVSTELDRWFHGRRRRRRRIVAWAVAAGLTGLAVIFAWRIKQVPGMMFRTPDVEQPG